MDENIKTYIKNKREAESKNKPVPIKGTLTEEQFKKVVEQMGFDKTTCWENS